MRSLAELQGAVARALVAGVTPPAGALRGGERPACRLAIHERHYVTSLATALLKKFPACAWASSPALVTRAARAFVRAEPPRRPCIAEYGREFPAFLASFAAAGAHLGELGELEWLAGEVSIAVDEPPIAWRRVAALGAERLLDAALVLQPGVRYLESPVAVDDLLLAHLRARPPFEPRAERVRVEVRGARGEVTLTRLGAGGHAFRAALARGATVGTAAAAALDADGAFDAGAALHELVAGGLAVGIAHEQRGA